jgi:hypothetical protein
MMLLALSVPLEDWFTPCEHAGLEAAAPGHGIHRARRVVGGGQRRCRAGGMRLDETGVVGALPVQMAQQAIEQPHIAAGFQRQM